MIQQKSLLFFIILTCLILLLPNTIFAQEETMLEDEAMQVEEQIFEAEVLDVLSEKEITRENGTTGLQQNVQLKGLTKNVKDKEMTYFGISDLEVVSAVTVEKGDKVIVSYSKDIDGNEKYFIQDHVRRAGLFWLALIFCVLIIAIGKWKGIKALISLAVTFFIIMKWIVPKIMTGSNPLLISLIGAVVILAVIVYLTWGWKNKSHLAMLSIFISLIVTGLISIVFTKLTKLSGLAQDDVVYLIGINGVNINFEGLLLAGIIIGTLGVLDDVVISQISTVEQIKEANPNLSKKELFKRGLRVGVDHISSMTNTLFLAYAGAALPLLMLFNLNMEPFISFSQVINNEVIAVEIVRTLTGSIGLILAMPCATILAARYLKIR